MIMIGFRITEKLKQVLQKLADEENRTLSSFLLNAVLYYIREEKGVNLTKEGEEKPGK
jgi:uncharacterized protein (DUF1778 family)